MKQSFRISGTFELTSLDAYANKLKSIQAGNLVDLWPLNDPTTAVAHDEIDAARNGSYTNNPVLQAVLFADGANYEPAFVNAQNQFVQMNIGALSAVLNRSEGTLLIWVKQSLANLNSATPYTFVQWVADASNFIRIVKINVANQYQWVFQGGGVAVVVTQSGISDPNWVPLVMTWSIAGNRMRAYYKGTQQGADQSPLPVNVGALAVAALGSDGAIAVDGSMGFAALWTKELTPAEVLSVSTVP